MTSVLVLRRGGLGDTLLMLPMLRALRRADPATALHFAGVLEFAAVLRSHDVVDAALSSEDLGLWTLATGRGDVACERLRRYSRVIADDSVVAAAANMGTRVQVFDTLVRGSEPFGLQLARQVGLSPVWPDDAWLVPPRAQPASGPVVLAPGSGGRHKCWPKERWLELAARLAAAGCVVQVVVGPVEVERDDPRRWSWLTAVAFVVEAQPVALAVRLRSAGAFVGNDSGPTHLAAMLGVPTVAIFGPTSPNVWAPVGPHVAMIGGRDGAFESTSVAAVLGFVVRR